MNPLARAAALPGSLAGIDLAATARALEAALRAHGARTQTHPTSALLLTGKLPNAAVASFVLESDRIARAVVTHLRVPPFVAGLAVVVHPRPEVEAPLLVADLMVTPAGRSRALLDAAGPTIANQGFAARFGEPLARIADGAHGLSRATVPAWLAPVSGNGGATLRGGRGEGPALAAVLSAYVAAYLDGLASANVEVAGSRTRHLAARAVGDLVRANGPAKRWLTRTFGEPTANAYLRLFWRDDGS